MGEPSVARGVPDIAWIRQRVPIADVATALGLTVIGGMVRCWRPDAHQHGDRTPSVGLDADRNKAKCFVCDERQISNVDLVMNVVGLDTRAAVLWIAEHFDVHYLPKGARLVAAERWPSRYLASRPKNPFSLLIRSGVWATLPATAQSVLNVLLEFADERDECRISYGGIARYGGIGGTATVSRALKLLQELHAVEAVERRPLVARVPRDAGCYRLTLSSPELSALAEGTHAVAQRDIAVERELRAKRRRQLRQQRPDKLHASEIEASTETPSALITGITLSSKNEARENKTLQKLNRAVEPAAAVEDHASEIEACSCAAQTQAGGLLVEEL